MDTTEKEHSWPFRLPGIVNYLKVKGDMSCLYVNESALRKICTIETDKKILLCINSGFLGAVPWHHNYRIMRYFMNYKILIATTETFLILFSCTVPGFQK